MNQHQAAETFIKWLENRVLIEGRGDSVSELSVEPKGKFWFGRLASDKKNEDQTDRGERLEPCALTLRVVPKNPGPWKLSITIRATAWIKSKDAWNKAPMYQDTFEILCNAPDLPQSFKEKDISSGLAAALGSDVFSGKIFIEKQNHQGFDELIIQFVNTSPPVHEKIEDTRLYETSLEINDLEIIPFKLESLPDSFRYDRDVWAYGVNSGVEVLGSNNVSTLDTASAQKMRPIYIAEEISDFKFTFDALAKDPIELSESLLRGLTSWGEKNWSSIALDTLGKEKLWSAEMRQEASTEAQNFDQEVKRIRSGIQLLKSDENLKRSFILMNEAMKISSEKKRYDSWRPFQLGFLLANLHSIVNSPGEEDIVDIVWFATGGGKTETYLGLLIAAAFYDRLRGKYSGITAWSRFPLRMLSLQQTQRFADAFAAAEIVRRKQNIIGDPFSMGFFVGENATPNSLKFDSETQQRWDPDDPSMPLKLRILDYCPFCNEKTLEMGLNRKVCRIEHRCTNTLCEWPEDALPFYLVDDEIYRFLPTVIVGTLDKAASLSMQASMRGFVGAPMGICSKSGHGYTYAKRSTKKNGCLVPGCDANINELPQAAELYGPSFRLQDELHLLRDSLGAVDSHYESVFDGIQEELCGKKPKIVASSATLMGYQKQSDVLYRRKARVFPVQGPTTSKGFWASDSKSLMRRYVAIAPRGVTIEYAVDRLVTILQQSIRELIKSPQKMCADLGIPLEHVDFLISNYGTNVIYGNTLKDLDAVTRSLETQVNVEGILNTASLTGKTGFEEIRTTLNDLENPKEGFEDRLHVVSASSMMSHGVDINRLNIMVMLGLPLGAADFIQATARVGRTYPGLVFVVHKIGRERDAGVFRSFAKFIEQGDRFVESIPITRKSRRVLARTIAGIEQARIFAIHEPKSAIPLTIISALKKFFTSPNFSVSDEEKVIHTYLGLEGELDEAMKEDIGKWFKNFVRNLNDPPTDAMFFSDASPTKGPMRSLRDVEEQVPIYGNDLE